MSLVSKNSDHNKNDMLVLADLSFVKIFLCIAATTLLFVSLLTRWEEDTPGFLSKLFSYPVIRYAEEFLCGIINLSFILLLFRRFFISNVAVYISNNQLFWVHALGSNSIDLSKIKSISKSALPGIILISDLNGNLQYLGSLVTQSSSSELISKINKEMALSGHCQSKIA